MTSVLLVLLMIAVCVGLPLFSAWRMFRLRVPSRAAWLVHAADAGLLVALVLLIGRWDIAGYYTRLLVTALFLVALARSFARHAGLPWRAPATASWQASPATAASAGLLALALLYTMTGLAVPRGARDLVLPLAGGDFMVGQGGGIKLLNYHSGHPEQSFAADFTALGPFGFRASGLAPTDPADYVIFGLPVVSPCAGEVIEARGDLPDLDPPARDRDHPRGNHVVIACEGLIVTLAHLQSGSVTVDAGAILGVGDQVALVGNTGNTT